MGVKPGGCSGYSYEMFFDTDKFDGDVIEEYDGVNIVVDGQSPISSSPFNNSSE